MSPRLPRKRGGDPRGRQGVHPTPWQRKRGGDPRDTRAYIRPLGNAHCPTPATQKRRRPQGRQGVHPTPWQCTLSHACHAKEAETKGRQGVHPTPWQCTLSPRLPRTRGGDPRDARAYIRPLGNAHCPTPATQKRRRPKGRQGVHLTPWQCTLSPRLPRIVPTPATQKEGGDPRDARAYIRPLGSAHCPTPATHCLPRKRGGDPRDARAYIRPLGSAHCPTPATQKMRRPKGCQGVHPTPSRCALSPRLPRKRGTPGRTSDALAVQIIPRLPRKRGGARP